MTTHYVSLLWIFISCLALVLIHVVHQKRQRKSFIFGLFGFISGLVLFVGISDYLLGSQNLVMNNILVRESYYRPEGSKNRPVVLLVGSSYTRAAVDPDLMTDIFNRQGYDVQVMTRAAGGTSRLEQWSFVKEVEHVLGKMPEIVMFEVSLSYDHRPVYALKSDMSARSIKQFSDQGAIWALKALMVDDKDKALYLPEQKGEAAIGILKHWAANKFNIGLAHNVVLQNPQKQTLSYFPIHEVEADYDPVKQVGLIQANKWELKEPIWPKFALNNWIKGYFSDVERMVLEQGGQKVSFFAVPIGSPGRRKYASQFCYLMAEKTCINGNERQFFDQLDQNFWIDTSHLKVNGAKLYSKWLAEQIVKAGILP